MSGLKQVRTPDDLKVVDNSMLDLLQILKGGFVQLKVDNSGYRKQDELVP